MCWSKRCWCCPSGLCVVSRYGDPVYTVAERPQVATANLTPPFAVIDLDALVSNAASMITRAGLRVATPRPVQRERIRNPARVVPVLRELRGWIDDHDERVCFPIEVRVAAADDIWLSTAYQRETGYCSHIALWNPPPS
jgi:hypothetical protein